MAVFICPTFTQNTNDHIKQYGSESFLYFLDVKIATDKITS